MSAEQHSEKRFLMGNEAIGRGMVEAGCGVVAAYPGTPSSEVLESLVRWKKELDHPVYLEWSVNEKVAFEVAYGASLGGMRAGVVMKMVGLNVASDPFMSAAYLGVRGGLVIVVADDPGPHSSQTEQDSRFFAWFAKVPVFDPCNPAEAREMAIHAFELSERYEVPVLLRPCLRVCHARQNVPLGPVPGPADVGPFKKNWTRWAAIPKFRLVLHRELNDKLATIRSEEPAALPKLVAGSGNGTVAVITSGSVSSHVRDLVSAESALSELDVYKVDLPYPANREALDAVVDNHEKTIVIEETYPVLELQLLSRQTVMGRMDGTVPDQGELTPEVAEDLLHHAASIAERPRVAPTVKPRRPSLCAGCPHRPAFYMVKSVFEETVFTGDIGCYTLGINMGAVDTCLCMGASIGMAGGLSRVSPSEGRMGVVATIGDSTFYHSGVPALINAVHTRAPFVLVIMDNNVTAMTGGQPTPAHDYLADGSQGTSVDLETVIRGCGVESTAVVDPYDRPRLEEALRQAKAFTLEQKRGVSVVITRRPCVRMPNVTLPSERFYITDKCDLCMTCLRDLECPAFEYTKSEKLMEINADLCAGCGFCVQVCPAGAIELKEA